MMTETLKARLLKIAAELRRSYDGSSRTRYRCAETIEALLADLPASPSEAPSEPRMDEMLQKLEKALWGKIGNTWEVTQLRRVEAMLREAMTPPSPGTPT